MAWMSYNLSYTTADMPGRFTWNNIRKVPCNSNCKPFFVLPLQSKIVLYSTNSFLPSSHCKPSFLTPLQFPIITYYSLLLQANVPETHTLHSVNIPLNYSQSNRLRLMWRLINRHCKQSERYPQNTFNRSDIVLVSPNTIKHERY